MWAGQSKWSQDKEPMGEINVTPLVDVMLVLLIIFMVTAPLLTQGVNIDLPDADAPAMQQNIAPVVISIRADGSTFIQEHSIKRDQLAARIQAMRKANPKLPVFIRGDAKTPYEHIAQIMSLLEQAGIKQIGLVTEPSHAS
ncbi:MAG: protein TolR [Zetaproteobacteria bacterium CG_4_9_14_3_um_filter_49_83]|nr:MAG: protein TolR [Zetaproteobacteria bacterium CG1_02_49_23]PIQ30728.1 MAG: protein TolR [Zetaproteobacteria bacterium CG17_big_fil_post_rev_8_21_14_2_50_50_13]PIV31359.1 MAG: protein TolR [Zetaproteobacteria bacterium CG02_land_8_20_14_3_00_50_9]PIY56851.1 MAG: protein TolR [Zetaproteobacteria bacterium CG_4_10_14_0_8_um_filter_49_80]PJA35139.1 MAG: protein TolR [Zetaproteobacteria bacterium CG_4_9_14_3_um_filter_49_83]